LLDQALTQNLRKEIDIFLRTAGAQRDVVNAFEKAFHASSLPTLPLSVSGCDVGRSGIAVRFDRNR
jgi:hypothetical protein